jgi:hypothetical protein
MFDTNKFINPHQVGGIESYILNDGDGRGVRVCEVNTGGGLTYRIAVDRGLDIDRAFMNGRSLAYYTHRDLMRPSRAYDQGMDWLKSFPGGLLTSCGPFNTGGPAIDEGESFGLHGPHSNTSATIESIIQPDPHAGQMQMSVTGIIRYGAFYGPNLELRRTIRSTLGEPSIHIQDIFTNVGNAPATHAWLLHINFGYPLLDEGTEFVAPVVGHEIHRGELSQAYFVDGIAPGVAQAPTPAHAADGKVFRYLTLRADAKKRTRAAIWNPKLKLGAVIDYSIEEFPRLGQWCHWGQREYVAALEPMTGGVDGRDDDRRRGWLRTIQPMAQQSYSYSISVVDQKPVV